MELLLINAVIISRTMKIQGRYLMIALLAGLTYLPAAPSGTALGQDATRVNIRVAVPQAPPGHVAARVTVSKSRVLVGEWVVVKLAPPAGVNRPVFRVSFGDGREEVTRNRQIDHKYGRVGHYDIYAWVESEAPRPPIPRVFLSVAPNPTAAERPVTFSAQHANYYPGIKYRFVFGDREQTGWQDQPQTTHSYAWTNTYQAYVDIGAEENGLFKLLGHSAREPVRVNDQQRDFVDLTASPTTVEAGRRVIFNARAISRDPNISYRFVFGDGSATGWQTNSQAIHEYASPNTYLTFVQIRASSLTFSSQLISSARKPIQVLAPQSLAVDLQVAPTTTKTETLVTFTARVNSMDANIRYRFFYGDGSSSGWLTTSSSSHKYSVARTYLAYVEAGRLNNNQRIKLEGTSKPKQIAVTSFTPPIPTPSPTLASSPTPSSGGSPSPSPGSSPLSSPGSSPMSSPGVPPRSNTDPTLSGDRNTLDQDWWKYLIIALLISFVGYWTYRFLFAPRPTFRPVPDAGGSGVDEATNPLAINSQILLRPDIADGLYRISTEEPNLVRSVRREND